MNKHGSDDSTQSKNLFTSCSIRQVFLKDIAVITMTTDGDL